MLYVLEDGTIKLTRGDTARLTIDIMNDLTKESYTMSKNDTLTLTVKTNVKANEFVFQKKTIGSNSFIIDPSDTNDASFGKYRYDVQLNTESGDVYTIIEPSTFEILAEVTY